MMVWTLRILRWTVAACALACISLSAASQPNSVTSGSGSSADKATSGKDYPKKTIKIVVGYKAGSAVDLLVRVAIHEITDKKHWNFVVVNQGGASGSIAMSEMLAAPADGYTVLMTASSAAYNIAQNPQEYGLDKMQVVSIIAQQPVSFVVNAKLPYKTLADLVTAEKTQNKVLSIAVPGVVDINTDAIYTFTQQAGIKFRWVPYEGGAPTTAAVVSGETDLAGAGPSNFMPGASSGELRFLAVSGKETYTPLPTVKTFAAQGYDVPLTNFYAFVVRKEVPGNIVSTFSGAFKDAMSSDGYLTFLKRRGMEELFKGSESSQALLAERVELANKHLSEIQKLFRQ